MTTVINLRNGFDVLNEPDIVRIDRETKFGNPFHIGRDGNRTEVIEKYRAWLWRAVEDGRIGLDDLAALDGKRLACWCAPQPCHGDVLARAARWAARQPPD